MIPKITSIIDRNEYKLEVHFDDGKQVIYDVSDDIKTIESFKDLINIPGLWEQFSLDQSRTCITWNDYIDIPSDTIYEYGVVI